MGEEADADAAAGFEGAFVGLFACGEDFEEGRFTGTVGAEHAAAFAFVEAEGDAGEEGLEAVGFGDFLTGEEESH